MILQLYIIIIIIIIVFAVLNLLYTTDYIILYYVILYILYLYSVHILPMHCDRFLTAAGVSQSAGIYMYYIYSIYHIYAYYIYIYIYPMARRWQTLTAS